MNIETYEGLAEIGEFSAPRVERDFTADRRLGSLGLPLISTIRATPFPWLDEVIFLRKEKNFFETRVTEYQTRGSLRNARRRT
jgi:ribonucleotide reductase beta subunit family protein with ferritin-like domain